MVIPYENPFGRRTYSTRAPIVIMINDANCQARSPKVKLYELTGVPGGRINSPSPAAATASKLNRAAAVSAGRLGSGNAHSQIIQIMLNRVTARSSGGRLRLGSIMPGQLIPLKTNNIT